MVIQVLNSKLGIIPMTIKSKVFTTLSHFEFETYTKMYKT